MDVSNLPKTRKQALKEGILWYYTGKPCIRGHVTHRYSSIGKCSACAREDALKAHVRKTDRRSPYVGLRGFIKRAYDIHGARYDYSQVVYENAHTLVDIICYEHGVFKQSPTNHLCGKHCPKCSYEAGGIAQRNTTKQFIESARVVWGSMWDYSKVDYIKAHSKVVIVCPDHGEFEQTPTNHLSGSVGCFKCNHMVSRTEEELAAFVSIYTKVIRRDRNLIKPFELDIYLPEFKVAIEFCGEYWHSAKDATQEKYMQRKHVDKYERCAALGVRLITIYESEWLLRKTQIKNLLRNIVRKNNSRVMARKCVVTHLDSTTANKFFDKYHIQGGMGGGTNYGLLYKGILVACMRFSKGINDRGSSKNRQWTLSRYATRVRVVGGASKLLNAFLMEVGPDGVKSFSDNRYFSGDMYKRLGFSLDEELPVDYMVWSPKIGLAHKSHYQRRNIPKRLQDHSIPSTFNPSSDPRTEAQMTYLMKCGRIYDCGKKRWLLTPPRKRSKN